MAEVTRGRFNARLVRAEKLDEDLAIVGIEPLDRPFAFRPGQYAALGIADPTGRLVQRPMSIASSADRLDEFEFFIRSVPGGSFTPLLWPLSVGTTISLRGPKGRLTLLDDDRECLLIASGTGLAPFKSMVATALDRGHERPLHLFHGVSLADHLAWREELSQLSSRVAWLNYVPTVSQVHASPDWLGATGRVESVVLPALGERFRPADTTIYVCGNPGMIAAVEATARARGFPDEQIRSERYWVAPSPQSGIDA